MERVVAAGGRDREVLVADPHGGQDVRTLRLEGPALVVLGAERNGPGRGMGFGTASDHSARVRFDSLNVAMAGTILLYELSRGPAGK